LTLQIYKKSRFNKMNIYINYKGVPASPSVSGYKSAAGSRVVAKPQKELPSVAFLWQRQHRPRPCGLSTYGLTPQLAPFALRGIIPIRT
jgi:hypothetical protein